MTYDDAVARIDEHAERIMRTIRNLEDDELFVLARIKVELLKVAGEFRNATLDEVSAALAEKSTTADSHLGTFTRERGVEP